MTLIPSNKAPSPSAKDRLIVALDFPSADQAFNFIKRLDGQCRWFKVGLELFLAEGPSVVTRLRNLGHNVFLDLKLHDIPNTVASAIHSIAKLDVHLLTVHAAGGPEMLRAAQEASASSPNLQLLAVTILTSMDSQQLLQCGIPGQLADQVSRLGRLADKYGLPGLVCSAEEIISLRQELGSTKTLVVPGIRPQLRSSEGRLDDQRRIATPAEAIQRGASMLVIGRPVTQAQDPGSALAAILDEIDRTLPDLNRSLGL